MNIHLLVLKVQLKKKCENIKTPDGNKEHNKTTADEGDVMFG